MSPFCPMSNHTPPPCRGYWWPMVLAWDNWSIWSAYVHKFMASQAKYIASEARYPPLSHHAPPSWMGYWWLMVLAWDKTTKANNAGTSHLQLPCALLLLFLFTRFSVQGRYQSHLFKNASINGSIPYSLVFHVLCSEYLAALSCRSMRQIRRAQLRTNQADKCAESLWSI